MVHFIQLAAKGQAKRSQQNCPSVYLAIVLPLCSPEPWAHCWTTEWNKVTYQKGYWCVNFAECLLTYYQRQLLFKGNPYPNCVYVWVHVPTQKKYRPIHYHWHSYICVLGYWYTGSVSMLTLTLWSVFCRDVTDPHSLQIHCQCKYKIQYFCSQLYSFGHIISQTNEFKEFHAVRYNVLFKLWKSEHWYTWAEVI